jgi:DDE superfamily endonuclease
MSASSFASSKHARHDSHSQVGGNDEEASEDSLLSESNERSKRRKILAASLALVLLLQRKRRAPNIERHREARSAEYFIRIGELEGTFLQEHGVTIDAFRKLANLLRADLEPKPHGRRSLALDVETKLLITLRYLRGGEYWDIIRKHGIGRTTLFDTIHQVMDAIDASPDIGKPKWPTTEEECNAYANEWAKLSGPNGSKGLFKTVIGMVDGILIKIRSPRKNEDICVEDYRSGHKKQIGINTQALCDAKLRFLFISAISPGKTNDYKAYEMSALSSLIEDLPEGYWCGGDNAYCTTEHLLAPFPGKELPRDKDAFNFFLSQLRVRIENAFALYVNRWGIFWKPLRGELEDHTQVIRVTARLHNFTIDEKVSMPSNEGGKYGKYRNIFQTTAERDFGTVVLQNRELWLTRYQFTRAVNGPELRKQLTAEIESLGYGRSDENIARNMARHVAAV